MTTGSTGSTRSTGSTGLTGLTGFTVTERWLQQKVKLSRSERKATKMLIHVVSNRYTQRSKKTFVNNPNGEISSSIPTNLQRILDALVFNNTKYLTL